MIVRLATAGDDFEYLNHRAYLPLAGLIILLVSVTPEKIPFLTRHLKRLFLPCVIIALALMTLVQQRKFANAERFWTSAIDDSPSRAWFYYYLGRYYEATKDYNTAEKALQTALSLKEYPRFYYELGLLYFWSGKEYEKSFVYMEKAVLKHYSEPKALKDFAAVSSETGRLFFEKGEYAKAIERCKIALDYDSMNPALYFNLGIYYIYMGYKEKAPLQWRRALKLDSGLVVCYKNLYLYYQANTTLTDSVRFFEREYKKRISK